MSKKIEFNVAKATDKQLEEFIFNYGKRANTRLARLEDSGLDTMPSYQYLASKLPGRDKLTTVSSSNHLKLVVSKNQLKSYTKTKSQYRAILERQTIAIRNFLNAESSTKSGVKSIKQRTIASLNQNNNLDISEADFENFFKSGGFDRFTDKNRFSSEQVMKVIRMYGIDTVLGLDPSDISNARTIRDYDRLVDEVVGEGNATIRTQKKKVDNIRKGMM